MELYTSLQATNTVKIIMEKIIFMNVSNPWFFPVCFFIFGAVVGSFLNVCIFRIPQKKSLVFPSSQNAEGDPIVWYDKIPILSWFILLGKDRKTGKPFSFRYPFIEILTAILFLLLWLIYHPAVAVFWMLFFSIILVAAFIDLDHFFIPDRCSIGGMLLGISLSVLVPELHDVNSDRFVAPLIAATASLQGMLIASGSVLWIGILSEKVLGKETMGFGDVKFMGCIGAFCGWQGGIFALFGGAVIGTVLFLFIYFFKKLFKKLGKVKLGNRSINKNEDMNGLAVPFAPLLASGSIVYVLGFRHWVDSYFTNIVMLFRM